VLPINAERAAMQPLALLVARLLLALIFLVMAVRQIVYWAAVQRDMAAHGLALTGPLLLGAITVELIGGAALVLGYEARAAAIVLAAYTLVATAVFYRRIADREILVHALKNLAIIGGLIMLAAVGPGPFSLAAQP
jgi:putative oxidoreductase